MAEQFILGFQAKLYHGPSGAPATNLIGNVRDLTVGLENGEVDITTRETEGWRAFAPTLTEASLDFQILWRPGTASFEAIKNAFLNKTTIAFRVLDKVIGEGEGLDADFIISTFTRNENLEEALVVDVSAKIGISTRSPNWETP